MSANSVVEINTKSRNEILRTYSNPNLLNVMDSGERPSCKFGKQCNRNNVQHRVDVAHPGDVDYVVPDMPEPKKDALKCQYGRKCYRLNPEHFRNFIHPRNINIQGNYRKYVLQKDDHRRNSDSSSDSEDSGDPFADESGSNYNPSDDED